MLPQVKYGGRLGHIPIELEVLKSLLFLYFIQKRINDELGL